jgi:hypothetical protein
MGELTSTYGTRGTHEITFQGRHRGTASRAERTCDDDVPACRLAAHSRNHHQPATVHKACLVCRKTALKAA